jgi:hypothetical protein
MSWTSGYVSDVEYTAGFYPEQSPVLLNFVAVLNGYQPLPLDRPFNYLELGLGRGVTVNFGGQQPERPILCGGFQPGARGGRQCAGQ